MIRYISHQRAADKLCLHCVHFQEGFWGQHVCNLVKSKVTGGAKWSCEVARESWLICGGRKWKLRDKIVPVDADRVEKLNYEEGVEECMKHARELVERGELPMYTTGFLEEAIRRVKQERGEDYKPRI